VRSEEQNETTGTISPEAFQEEGKDIGAVRVETAAGLDLRTQTEANSYGYWHARPLVDVEGNDLGGISPLFSVQECSLRCEQTPGCQSFAVQQQAYPMQQAMGGMNGAGAPQAPAIPDAQGGAQQAAPPNPMFNPDMMQQMMQAMQSGGMGNGLNGGLGSPNPADTRPPEERFATQVQQLENMGFPDKHSNLQALSQCNGDVNEAINSLLGGA